MMPAGYHVRRLFAQPVRCRPCAVARPGFSPAVNSSVIEMPRALASFTKFFQRGIPQPPFDSGQIRPVHVGFLRKFLLRPALFVAEFAQPVGEGAFRLERRGQTPIVDFCRL